jgi:hypothetical protein
MLQPRMGSIVTRHSNKWSMISGAHLSIVSRVQRKVSQPFLPSQHISSVNRSRCGANDVIVAMKRVVHGDNGGEVYNRQTRLDRVPHEPIVVSARE